MNVKYGFKLYKSSYSSINLGILFNRDVYLVLFFYCKK